MQRCWTEVIIDITITIITIIFTIIIVIIIITTIIVIIVIFIILVTIGIILFLYNYHYHCYYFPNPLLPIRIIITTIPCHADQSTNQTEKNKIMHSWATDAWRIGKIWGDRIPTATTKRMNHFTTVWFCWFAVIPFYVSYLSCFPLLFWSSFNIIFHFSFRYFIGYCLTGCWCAGLLCIFPVVLVVAILMGYCFDHEVLLLLFLLLCRILLPTAITVSSVDTTVVALI